MDGTFAPLMEVVETLEELYPGGNGHLIVDEAHATGIYGPQGRGLVALLGLEKRVLARLHTFGKALAGTGGQCFIKGSPIPNVLWMNNSCHLDAPPDTRISVELCSYLDLYHVFELCQHRSGGLLIRYVRKWESASSAFNFRCSRGYSSHLYVDQLAVNLLALSATFVRLLRPHLVGIPATLLSLPTHLQEGSLPLPSAIIPIMTSQPRALSAFLHTRGMNARPITWPTVPKGKDRVRVCLHAGNKVEDIEMLVAGIVDWAEANLKKQGQERGQWVAVMVGLDGMLESKL